VNTFSTIYKIYYDIFVDWSLIQFEPISTSFFKKILREDLIFHPIYYIISIILNVVLRFFWLISFIVMGVWGESIKKYKYDSWISITTAALEIIRRANWNIIRVENEQLNNVGEYRATKDIPLPFETTKFKYEKDNLTILTNGIKKLFGVHDEKMIVDDEDMFSNVSLKSKNLMEKLYHKYGEDEDIYNIIKDDFNIIKIDTLNK
jgi:hypothetical protein